jgi:hypothetical protein
MKRSYVITVSHWDASGVLRAFGPYDTEQAAHDAQPALLDLYGPDPGGKWEVIPMFTITTED